MGKITQKFKRVIWKPIDCKKRYSKAAVKPNPG
jgi:hypothetical protein